jgi:hypothetical protein
MTIVVNELTIAEAHSLLTIVQRFCQRTGLSVPTTVYGTSDTQVQQILGLLEEEGTDLARRGAWEGITFEATHTTVAAESQGAMTTIASNGFNYIKNDTIWDRTDDLPVLGPVSAQEWQALKAMSLNGPRYQFRIRGGNLIVNPTPTAGHTWAFEYVSKNWITDSTGTTYRQYFGADGDLLLLPPELLLMGLRWRWKKEKGLEYAEDFRTYEMQVKDALGRDGGKPVLMMNSEGRSIKPGIFVTPMSWDL